MEFSRQEYWSVLPFLSPGDLSDPGIKLALADGFIITSTTWEAIVHLFGDISNVTESTKKGQHMAATSFTYSVHVEYTLDSLSVVL